MNAGGDVFGLIVDTAIFFVFVDFRSAELNNELLNPPNGADSICNTLANGEPPATPSKSSSESSFVFAGFFTFSLLMGFLLWLRLKAYACLGGDSTGKCDGVNSDRYFKHRNNLNTSLPVDDQ